MYNEDNWYWFAYLCVRGIEIGIALNADACEYECE